MSEQKKDTLHQTQAKYKPTLEDMIHKCLDGEIKQAVTEFLEFCKVNKISCPWGATNLWHLKTKGKRIGDIRLGGIPVGRINYEKNTWYVYVYNDVNSSIYREFIHNENLTEIIWKNVKKCEGCLTSCAPGQTTTILDKDFNNVCICYKIRFKNPDTESQECMKKLLEFRKELIVTGKV